MAAWGAPSLGRRFQRQSPRAPVVVGSSRQPTTLGARSAPGVRAAAPQAPASAQALGWTPPPIPTGAYNPIRDIELNAGKRGASNTIEDLGTKGERGEYDFLNSEGEIKRAEGEQQSDHDQQIAAIQTAFKRLASRQTEGANAAGVLRGGALAQSAAKRAANEGKQREPVDQTLSRALAGDQRALGQLALTHTREIEDQATERTRAEREQAQFGIDTQTLEAREASEAGYTSPVSHLSSQPGAGFVSVGGPLKRNPYAKWGRR